MARGDRSRQGRERTPEERERDRLERERRRVQRTTTPAPEEPQPADDNPVPIASEPVPPSPEPLPPASLEPSPPAASMPPEQAPEAAPELPPEPPPEAAPELPPEADPEPAPELPPAAGLPPAPLPPAPAPASAEQLGEAIEETPAPVPEQPVGAWTPPPAPVPAPQALPVEPPVTEPAVLQTPPVPPVEPLAAAAGGEGGAAGAPPGGVRGAGRGGAGRGGAARHGRSPLARLGAVAALIAVVAAVLLLLHSLLRSGAKAPAAPAVVKVVIPEGLTRAQIAEIAAKAALRGSYRVASRRSHLLNPVHYGAPPGTRDLEGFLFPATYDEFRASPVSRLVSNQLIAFRENFDAGLAASARALHLTPYQLLIVASMVEREAQVPGDRAKIAAVIYNRLRQQVPLGIDATIYYAIEQEKNIPIYTRELSDAQLHIDSSYNTRTHVGLPPTPISNPGLASIEAAAHPAKVAYMYYVLAPDGCGEHVFSTTLAAFEVAAAAYQAAVKKNGGHPPVCKK